MRKKLWAAIVVLAILMSLTACGSDKASSEAATNGELIMGTEAGFAPYEYMSGDEVVGVDIDISNAIAEAMGKELVVKNMDFDGALAAVQSGKVDFVAAGVSITEERLEVMDFSHEYVDSTEVIVVNTASNPMEEPVDGGFSETVLEGKIVGVQQGNVADGYVSQGDFGEPEEVKRYTKFSQAAEDLKNNKIDCMVMDQYPAEEAVASNPQFMILDGVLFQDCYAIAVQKGNDELLDQINEVIDQLVEEGKIEEFTANHTTTESGSQLVQSLKKALITDNRYLAYLEGLKVTLLISVFAIIIGIVIGLLVAVAKFSASRNKKLWLLGKICELYTTVIRGTPVMVQLLIIYNLIFTSRNTNEIVVGAVCFGINSGAYVAEIIRAGIESVPVGQMEAGRSLGFNYITTMRLVIIPQAIKNILPAIGNELITLVKETSVAGVIAVTDLTKAAQYVGSVTWDILTPLLIAAAVYLIIVLVMTALLKKFERRLARSDHRHGSTQDL